MRRSKDQRWVIPSEFMPEIQLLGAKRAGSKRKFLLMPKHQKVIQDLLVDDDDLHATLSRFLTGNGGVTVGSGRVKVSTPAAYLEPIGHYKLSCDLNFERCLGTHEL